MKKELPEILILFTIIWGMLSALLFLSIVLASAFSVDKYTVKIPTNSLDEFWFDIAAFILMFLLSLGAFILRWKRKEG